MNNLIRILPLGLLFSLSATAEKVELRTPATSFVIELAKGAEPMFVYYGPSLTATDAANLGVPTDANWSHLSLYPAYGATHMQDEPCLAMRHADGSLSTQMLIDRWERRSVSDTAPNGEPRQGEELTIFLTDPLYPVHVELHYFTYADVDMMEYWTVIRHDERRTVTLTQYANPVLPIHRDNVYCTHFTGSWAAEAQLSEHPLQPGTLLIQDKDGTRNAGTRRNEMLFALDGPARENEGNVIATALLYSGNYRVIVDTDNTDYHYYMAGPSPDNAEYHLRRGETFTTPRTAVTYSTRGTNGASQNFHRWARSYQLRHGNAERMILLNSWEGVYFDINQEGMAQMMRDIKSMGGELFVMDDGWFGTKYPRLTDNCALGDWEVDVRKLPEGIDGLLRDAREAGVKFGIWIEPEMTNTVSELYEKHPEWVIKAPGREPVTGRGGTQLVLDLSNPAVQDYVFSIVDRLLSQWPDIAYIKWDANAPMMNHGSQYLSADDQSHLNIAYHRGLIDVCQRIRAKYPDVVIQDCASGGSRVNYGLLPYFDEFWVSDNTDALQRIYMQWGTSYFYPAIAMASHISAVPNHAVFRTTSLKFRCDVAMSGRLGMEIQPKHMSDEEKALCRRAIDDYKLVRKTVQHGDLFRLNSPYDDDLQAALMYVSPEKEEAVFFWYKLETMKNQHLPLVRMAGLRPDALYTVTELNRIDNSPLPFEGKTFSGAFLMNHGLQLPADHDVDWNRRNDWASRVLRLQAK